MIEMSKKVRSQSLNFTNKPKGYLLQCKEFMKKSLPLRFIFFQIHKILHSPRSKKCQLKGRFQFNLQAFGKYVHFSGRCGLRCVRLGNPDFDFQNLNSDFPIEHTLKEVLTITKKNIKMSSGYNLV